MSDERTSYTDRSPWPGFATAVLWASVLLSCYPILAGWGVDMEFGVRAAIVAGVVACAAALSVVLGGLTVRVQETRLFIHLGRVPLVRRVVPYAEILDLEPVIYRPMREFGGWGVRGRGARRAWTARGDRAVKLTLTGDRELLVGSDHPRRLAERIRSVAGDAIAGTRRPTRP